ncbi:universal stress protein [Christiangramia fulva]|uniref:Universal stress protein n=1 Tax=Christiangramia fulva TaxID=2126553 RepID=A0A2R3ZA29_9FLAO|nr:universal stress protein [Christiangramia fulva]AVR47032.1 universal stress protein [Christiangramia fulva]
MEKKILIPTNFSKHVWHALIVAMQLYHKHPCTFYLLNVYSSPGFLGESLPLNRNEESQDSAREISEKGLDRIMKGLSFRQENARHSFETISYQGNLIEGIQEQIEKLGIDLVILGAAGESSRISASYDSKISSITEEVEQCPVFIIPEEKDLNASSGTEIVFPSNFRIPFKQKELEALLELANNLKASVRVLYINSEDKPLTSEQEENKADLARLLEDINFSFHTLTQTSPTVGVHLFLQSRESEILALYQRKQGFFSRLFHKTRLDDIDFDPKLPVLVLKEFQ